MKIRILKATNCDGESVKAGDVIPCETRDARFLLAVGFAEEVTESATPKKKSPVNRMAKAEEQRDSTI